MPPRPKADIDGSVSSSANFRQPGSATGDEGRYTGGDLAADVTLAANLRQLAGGDMLGERAAELVLGARLGAGTEEGFDSDLALGRVPWRAVAEIIVDSLPPELRTQAVMDAIDLRPYLDALEGKKLLERESSALPFGPEHTNVRVVELGGLRRFVDQFLETTLTSTQEGSSMSDEARAKALEQSIKYKPGEVGLVLGQKAVSVASGQPIVDGDFGFDTSTVSTVVGQQMAVDQIELAFRSGFLDLEGLVNAEADMAGQLPGGYFPVGVAETFDVSGETRGGRRGIPATKTRSVSEVVGSLKENSPTQIETLQRNMAAAGYFDRTGATSYAKGEWNDEATFAAWSLLVSDSVKQGQSIPKVLGAASRDYRKQVRAERLAGVSELDPSYTRVLADDWAQSVLGRRLSPEEQRSMHEQLIGLRVERAGFVAGADDNTIDEGLQMDRSGTGIIGDDVTLALENRFELEQRTTSFMDKISKGR